MKPSLRVYRLLIRLYPAAFREEFRGPLERQFKDDYAEVQGCRGRVAFWFGVLWDALCSIPNQLTRELSQDARHAVRLWRRQPGHTLFVVAVLAIAIGAVTGVFGVLNALLLKSLPFQEPHRLAALKNFVPKRAEFHTWRVSSSYLSDAAMYDTLDVNVDGASAASRQRLTETSANFFTLLGCRPVLGRTFAAGEDAPGSGRVAVLGDALWQQLYGRDPRVLGAALRINGTIATVIGVMPAECDFPGRTDLWMPTTFDYEQIPKTGSVLMWSSIGRLRDGLTWAQARHAFEAEAYQHDPGRRTMDLVNRPALVPLQDDLAGRVKQASMMLSGGVGLLWLLAYANLANLLLARTVSRSSELSIRTALGASRARLAQQLVTESMLLTLISAVAGLVVAYWTAQVAAAAQPAQLAVQAYDVFEPRVLAFSIGLALLTGVVFAVGPALYASRAGLVPGSRQLTASTRHSRMRATLIAVQVAISVVLVTAAAALGAAFLKLVNADSGYDVSTILTLNVSLAGTSREAEGNRAAYYQTLLERLRQIPGVTAVSGTQALPLATDAFAAGRYNVDRQGPLTLTPVIGVWPGFVGAVGGRVIAGREFVDDDLRLGQDVVLVSDAFAAGFGPPASLIGQTLTGPQRSVGRIVGVVRWLRYGAALDAESQVFILTRAPRAMTVVVRTAAPAYDRLAAVRGAAQAVDARVPVFDVKTMDERLAAVLARPRFYATAVTFFGGFGLLLAVVGIYGMITFTVTSRTREIGIRLALGATPARVRHAVLGYTLLVVLAGIAAGLGAVVPVGQYLNAMVAGAEHGLLAISATVAATTTLVGALAVWSATRRIGSLDVTDVLRAETAS